VNGAGELNALASSMQAIAKAGTGAIATNLNKIITSMSKLSTIKGSEAFDKMAQNLDKFSTAAKKAGQSINAIKPDTAASGITKVSNAANKSKKSLEDMGVSAGKSSKFMTLLTNALMFFGSRSNFSLSQMGAMMFHMERMGKIGIALIPVFMALRVAMGIFRTIGNAISYMGQQVVVGVKEFMKFEDELTTIAAVANIPKTAIDSIGDAAMQMAVKTGIARDDIVSAMGEIARAGISGRLAGPGTNKAEAIAGTADILTKFQKGTGASASEAQSIVIGTATMWQSSIKSLEDLTDATDVWSASLNATFLDADKLQTALQYAGNTFALLGTNIKTTSALLGQLSQTGMKASKIGTAARAFGMSLVNPQQLDMLKQYGVDLKSVITDAETGKLLPDAPIRALRAIKESGLTETAGGQGILNEIFGKVSGSSIAFLAETVEQVQALADIDSKGYTKFLLAEKLESVQSQANRAKEAISNLRTEVGSAFGAPIKGISEAIANATQPAIDAYKAAMSENQNDVMGALSAGWEAFAANGGDKIWAMFQQAGELIKIAIMSAITALVAKMASIGNWILMALPTTIMNAFRWSVALLEASAYKIMSLIGDALQKVPGFLPGGKQAKLAGKVLSVAGKNLEEETYATRDKNVNKEYNWSQEAINQTFDNVQKDFKTAALNTANSMFNMGGSLQEQRTKFDNERKVEMVRSDPVHGLERYNELKSLEEKSQGKGLSEEETARAKELGTMANLSAAAEETSGAISDAGSAYSDSVDQMTQSTSGAANAAEEFSYANVMAASASEKLAKQQELMASISNKATMELANIVNSGISTSFTQMKSLMDDITGKSSLQNTPIPEEFAGSYKRSKGYISGLARSGQISAAQAEQSMQQLERSFGQEAGEGEKRSRRKKLQNEIDDFLDQISEATDDSVKRDLEQKVDDAREQMKGLRGENASFKFSDLKKMYSEEGAKGMSYYLQETEDTIGKVLGRENMGEIVQKASDLQEQIDDAAMKPIEQASKRIEDANNKKILEAKKKGYEGTVLGLESNPFKDILGGRNNLTPDFAGQGAYSGSSRVSEAAKNIDKSWMDSVMGGQSGVFENTAVADTIQKVGAEKSLAANRASMSYEGKYAGFNGGSEEYAKQNMASYGASRQRQTRSLNEVVMSQTQSPINKGNLAGTGAFINYGVNNQYNVKNKAEEQAESWQPGL
jgi:TP901 family phage tail tape measure protein